MPTRNVSRFLNAHLIVREYRHTILSSPFSIVFFIYRISIHYSDTHITVAAVISGPLVFITHPQISARMLLICCVSV